MLERLKDSGRIEVKVDGGILILYANKQWEFISDKSKRTVV